MTAGEAQSLTLKSTLAFALAFNLTFFIQEWFLVMPKALTPGLEPTLFHNNHTWRGHHPIENLLQGSGALATVISGGLFSYWLVRHPPAGQVTRLLMFWMAVLGFLAALPQVVIGSVIAQNDVGRALNYLGFTPAAKALASAAAMFAMAAVCWRLAPYLLSLIADPGTPRGRAFAMFNLGVLPCVLAVPVIVPFRIPNAPIEVLLPPGLDALVAAVCLQAAAFRVFPARLPAARPQSPIGLLIALAGLFAIFHLVLRPGIDF